MWCLWLWSGWRSQDSLWTAYHIKGNCADISSRALEANKHGCTWKLDKKTPCEKNLSKTEQQQRQMPKTHKTDTTNVCAWLLTASWNFFWFWDLLTWRAFTHHLVLRLHTEARTPISKYRSILHENPPGITINTEYPLQLASPGQYESWMNCFVTRDLICVSPTWLIPQWWRYVQSAWASEAVEHYRFSLSLRQHTCHCDQPNVPIHLVRPCWPWWFECRSPSACRWHHPTFQCVNDHTSSWHLRLTKLLEISLRRPTNVLRSRVHGFEIWLPTQQYWIWDWSTLRKVRGSTQPLPRPQTWNCFCSFGWFTGWSGSSARTFCIFSSISRDKTSGGMDQLWFRKFWDTVRWLRSLSRWLETSDGTCTFSPWNTSRRLWWLSESSSGRDGGGDITCGNVGTGAEILSSSSWTPRGATGCLSASDGGIPSRSTSV